MRRELGALSALILICAHGAGASSASPVVEQRAYLELILNEQSRPPVAVLLRGDDALVAAADLEAAGLHDFGGRRELFAGQEWVSLASLAPEVAFTTDEKALSLRITAAPRLLERTVIDLRTESAPPGLTAGRDTSAFFNYSVRASTAGLDGFAELGASYRGDLLYTGVSRLADGHVVRGLSNFTVDDPADLRRTIAGDAVQGASLLGGGATLFGLTVQREYSLNPYFVRSPLPGTSGFASTPSTLEVYVNGQLVRRQPIAPGSFDVLNLPLSSGDGSYRTVVRDAFGRASELSSRYYYSTGVLGKGLQEYGYSAGLQRTGFGLESFSYGGPAFIGHHRYGFTDWLTAGGRLEMSGGLTSGGASATARATVGEVEAGFATSGGSHHSGAAASLSWLYASRRVSGGVLLRAQSPSYATLSLRPGDDRALWQGNLFVGAPLFERLSLNAGLQAARMRDAGNQLQLSLRADFLLRDRATLSLTATRTAGAAAETQVFCAFNWVFDLHTLGSASLSSGSSGAGGGISVQRTLGEGPGFGYLARADQGPAGASAQVAAQAQNEHGRIEAEYDRAGAANAASVTASGAVVLIGGDAFFSRAVQDGYALLQVPGVAGVRGLLNNQVVGRTDSAGNLLVTGLLPYFGNQISIEPSDVPFDRAIDRVAQMVAPSLRGGALARFELARIRALKGSMAIDGEEAPAGGELTVYTAQGERASPLGTSGQFFLEQVPPGRHKAVIQTAHGDCALELTVPETDSSVDLGTLRCRREMPVASEDAR